jgi:threonine dehydrogenase-like Zn-dependent dehydrogenase
MRALVVRREPLRFVAARLLRDRLTEQALESGPLVLEERGPLPLPGTDWVRVRPLLAGICGSDLATVFFHSSRYFEPLTSLPFVPGHEIVCTRADEPGARYVVEPALTCAVRGVPLCPACEAGTTQLCSSITLGDLKEGIQLGYCNTTGGGWSTEFVAHTRMLHAVPEGLSDTDAVMVEPLACALHTVLAASSHVGRLAIVGAGTVGLAALAVAATLEAREELTIAAKHPIQREFARALGATSVVGSDELLGRARRLVPSNRAGRYLGGGYDTVIDAVGSASSLELAITAVRPGGEVVLAGMPTRAPLDLAPLWHREVRLVGSYAYGTEHLDADLATRAGVDPGPIRTFALALALAGRLGLGRLVTHRYRLVDYVQAIEKAHRGGRDDAVKVVFDLTMRRSSYDA